MVGDPAPSAHDTAMGLPRLSAALYWCSIHNRLTAAPAARLTSGKLCFTHELLIHWTGGRGTGVLHRQIL